MTIFIFNSCKKTDTLVADTRKGIITGTPENFFKLPANASPVLQRIAKELERQNATKEFITAFIDKEGFPIWGKSRIEKHAKNDIAAGFDADGLADTTVYIPLVVNAEHYVTGFLKATINDSVRIKIFRQSDYMNFPFKTPASSANVTTAEEYAVRFMSMDKDVFGSTEFKIKDKRMFNNSTNYSDTANIQRFIKLGSGGDDAFANGSTISNYQYEVCWTVTLYRYVCGSTFSGSVNNGQGILLCWVPDGTTSVCTTYETEGGGGGVGTWPFPGGGGGGGNGGSSNIPCSQEFGAPITNSVIPIECHPTTTNQWPQQTPQTWFDDIWLTYNVKDSTGDPCIKQALDSLKSIEKRLPVLIRGFFGTRPNFEMVFKKHVNSTWTYATGAIAPTPPPGAVTVQNLTTSIFDVSINRYYADCTDLGLAATIVHEALHCHLMNCYRLAYSSPDSTAIRVDLATRYGYLFPPPNINANTDSVLRAIINGQDPAQHQDMVTRYLSDVANALLIFAQSKGISNIDISDCRDLAWTGCFDSRAFANLSAADKTRIKNRCFAEKDPYANLSFTDNNNYAYTVNENNFPEKGHPCH